MLSKEIMNSDEFQDILEELLEDFSSTKTLWLKYIKRCNSTISKFIPNSVKRELASKTMDEITLEVAEHLYYNRMENK